MTAPPEGHGDALGVPCPGPEGGSAVRCWSLRSPGSWGAGRLHLTYAEYLGSAPRSTSLCLSFPIREMGTETVRVSEACWEDWRHSQGLSQRWRSQ